MPTTARDVRWTLEAARDPVVGYPRAAELASLARVDAPDDSTVTLEFTAAPAAFPDVLTDLAILPAHLLDTVPRDRLRQAAWNDAPVGNGPFRFVAHEPNRRWVFAANPEFPAALGGRPRLDRLIIVVVDEPATKLAALTAGELDFAGIQPAHAQFVARNPDLAVVSYPLLLTYGIVLNTRRPPFAELQARRRLDASIDRRAIVQGYLYGFGTPARDPVPSELPGYVPVARDTSANRGGSALRFELLTVGSGEAPLEQMVQAQLRGVGMEVTIRQLELSAFLARVYGPAHDFQAAVLGVPGDAGLAYLGSIGAVAGVPLPAEPAAAQRMCGRLGPDGGALSRSRIAGDESAGARSPHGSSRRVADGARLVGGAMTGVFRAAAPVRLDFAGGWTDVPPFSAREGGVVVSAAIGLHAHAEVRPGGEDLRLTAEDLDASLTLPNEAALTPYRSTVPAAGRPSTAAGRPLCAAHPLGCAARLGTGQLGCARRRAGGRAHRRPAPRPGTHAWSPTSPAGSKASRPPFPAVARTSSPRRSAGSFDSAFATRTPPWRRWRSTPRCSPRSSGGCCWCTPARRVSPAPRSAG